MILVLGEGPPPPDARPAPSQGALRHTPFSTLRLWQGVRALAHAGLPLTVLAEGPGPQGGQALTLGGHPLTWVNQPLTGEAVRQHALALRPSAVISLGPFGPARAASTLPRPTPLWIDLPGDMMAEAQLRGDSHLPIYRSILMAALARGDHFSICSPPQANALMGQLGLMGRFTSQTRTGGFWDVIPPGVDPSWLLEPPAVEVPWPEGAPVIVHFGSLNTWSDVDGLAQCLRTALEERPSVHVLIAGGAVPGHAEAPERALRAALSDLIYEGPPLQETYLRYPRRVHWKGWVPEAELRGLLAHCDIGLSIDVESVEAHLGARSRLALGVATGLHWVASVNTWDSQMLAYTALLTQLPFGAEDEDISEVLLREIDKIPERRRAKENDAFGYANRERWLRDHRPEVLMEPLVAWAKAPKSTPPGVELPLVQALEEVRELRRTLDDIYSSATWRLLGRLHRRLL